MREASQGLALTAASAGPFRTAGKTEAAAQARRTPQREAERCSDGASMKTSHVAAIALKVLSVYVVMSLLAFLSASLALVRVDSQMRRTHADNPALAQSLSPLVIVIVVTVLAYAIVAAVLFFKARSLGRRFTVDPEEEVSLAGPVSRDVLALAFRCLGLYALVTWVPQLTQLLTNTILAIARAPDPVPWMYHFTWISLVTPLTGSLVGLLLLWRTHWFTRLTDNSRQRSSEKTEATPT